MIDSIDISPMTALKIASGFVIVGVASYCIWRGRRVKPVRWEDDDNNPANWYLKDPNKFKKKM